MFERLLSATILHLTKIYLNMQIKKVTNSLETKGRYIMKITSTVGKINIAVSIKKSTPEFSDDGATCVGHTIPAEVANMNFLVEDCNSEIEMNTEEFAKANDIAIEDVKLCYDKFLAPAGARISGWIDRVCDTLQTDATEKRYDINANNKIDLERRQRELDRDFPKQK